MSGNKLFLDTNILIYFLRGDQDVVDMNPKAYNSIASNFTFNFLDI